jgi:hypothetical protein
MTRILFIYLALLSSTILRGQQNQEKLLLEAYQSNSSDKLALFFDNWAKETPSISNSEIMKMNDTIRNVYSLFKEFYDPLRIEKTEGSAWNNSYYKDSKYFLLQTFIRFGLVDTLDKDILIQKLVSRLSKKFNITEDSVRRGYQTCRTLRKWYQFRWPTPRNYDSIVQFRPQVGFQAPQTTELTFKYDTLIDNFVSNNHDSLFKRDTSATSKAESAKRAKFLEQCISMWYSDFANVWIYYSFPYVTSITFDRTLENAVLFYDMIGEGGYAYYKRKNGVWILIEVKRTWIA